MSSGTPENPFGEAQRAPANVRAQCLREVNQALADVQSCLETGQPIQYNSMVIGDIVLDMAHEAADSGDYQEAAEHVELLEKLPDVLRAKISESYFTCLEGGDETDEKLDSVLTPEMEEARVSIAVQKAQGVGNTHVSSQFLEGVIEGFRYRNSGAEDQGLVQWIEYYAPDKETSWKLYMRYYRGQMDAITRETDVSDTRQLEELDAYQRQVDSKVYELTGSVDLSPAFVLSQTAFALEAAENVELQKLLLVNFQNILHTSPDIPFEYGLLCQLVDVATIAIERSLLELPGNLDFFAGYISLFNSVAMQSLEGFNVTESLTKQLPWKLALGDFYNSMGPDQSTEALITSFNSDIAEVLATIPEDNVEYRDHIHNIRDSLLAEYARRHAKEDSPEDSAVFLAHIIDGYAREIGYKNCLSELTDLTLVDALKPDEEVLTMEPELALQFRATETRLRGDFEPLLAVTLEMAQGINVSNSIIRRPYIQRAFESLNAIDPNQSYVFTKEVLGALRTAGEPYTTTRYLSDELISAAGDEEEPGLALEQITATAFNESHRIAALWQLANTIDMSFGR